MWSALLILTSVSIIAEDVEIDVESMVWTLESDGLASSHAGMDHSYSTSDHTWLWPPGSAITATEQPYVSDIHQTSSKHDWNWFCVVNSSHSWHYGAPVCSTLARFKCNEFGDALFPQNDDYFLLFFPPPTSYDHIVDASCVHFRVGLQYTSACT